MSADVYLLHSHFNYRSPKIIFSKLFNGLKGYAYGVRKQEQAGSTTINIDTLHY